VERPSRLCWTKNRRSTEDDFEFIAGPVAANNATEPDNSNVFLDKYK